MTRLRSQPTRCLILTDLPSDLYHALYKIADKNQRTVNVQVQHMLIRALAVEDHLDRASELMAEIRQHGKEQGLGPGRGPRGEASVRLDE